MRDDYNNKYILNDYNKYDNIISKDYYIYKDPVLGKKDVLYYNNDDYKIGSYGNIVDSLISTLTPYELEKLKLLTMFVKGQGINNISNSDLLSFIRIVTDPSYDLTLKNLGTRINKLKGNTPNPSNVPVTPPIQPIITPDITPQNDIKVNKEEPKRANPLVEKFLLDIRSKQGSGSFRGWMLPNGELLSQYVDSTAGRGTRQDHAKLFKIFFNGLEKYNKDAYDNMRQLYDKYLSEHNVGYANDWDESFAVEALGWMQIAHNGRMRILYRGERWQDRLLRPFLYDYGFGFEISDFGDCHYVEYMDLYNHIDEIISLGLEEKYERR